MSSEALLSSDLYIGHVVNETSYGSINEHIDSLKHVQKEEVTQSHVVYKSRWYIISLVSMATVLNNYLWATYGPISESAKLVYGWSEDTLFLVINVCNITAFLFTLLGSFLVDFRGIVMVLCKSLFYKYL